MEAWISTGFIKTDDTTDTRNASDITKVVTIRYFCISIAISKTNSSTSTIAVTAINRSWARTIDASVICAVSYFSGS